MDPKCCIGIGALQHFNPGFPVICKSMLDESFRKALEKNLCCGCECAPMGDDDAFASCFSPRKLGRHTLLLGWKRGTFPFRLMIGPDWPAVILTYSLILGISIPCLYLQYTYINIYVFIVGLVMISVLLAAYSATACSDPGIIYKEDYEDEEAKENPQTQSFVGMEGAAIDESKSTSSGSGSGGFAQYDGANARYASVPPQEAPPQPTPPSSSTEVAPKGEDATPLAVGLDSADLETGTGTGTDAAGVSDTAPLSSNNVVITADTSMPSMPKVPKAPTHLCTICNVNRPFRATHCYYCNTCVHELDHHCPWSGQCIGRENLAQFHCFVGTIAINLWYCFGTFIYAMVMVASKTKEE